MKRTVFTLMAMMLMAVAVLADPADLVKQRAKAVRDANNQQQGVTSAPGPSPGTGAVPAPGATTPSQGISAAQQALLDRLETDLNVIKIGTTATADQKQRVQDDIALLAKGANKPSKAALTKLSTDLTTALAEKSLSANDMMKFTRNINIVVNSGRLTSARAQSFVNDAQILLKNSGVSAATVQLIVKDLNAIIVEVQKNKPEVFQ